MAESEAFSAAATTLWAAVRIFSADIAAFDNEYFEAFENITFEAGEAPFASANAKLRFVCKRANLANADALKVARVITGDIGAQFETRNDGSLGTEAPKGLSLKTEKT
jgi:hypothetical protein